MRPPFASRLFLKLARRAGVKINLEPRYGYAGQIVTKSGRKRYFKSARFDINMLGATEIAADKDYAAFFMGGLGYSMPKGELFFADHWAELLKSKRKIDAAYRYAKRLGLPVIVKPNSKSQGVGVVKAHTKREFYRAFRAAARMDTCILVQEPVTGKDYRLVVLDGDVISAYERHYLTVVGDGRLSIEELLKKKQRSFEASGRDTRLKLGDWRIKAKLSRQKLTLASVPARGEAVRLLDNANLSAGGDAEDVTEGLHPDFRKLAVRLTRDMGLRLCGVDLMVDGDIRDRLMRYWVIEINAAPGLDNYFAQGKKQERIVEGLYLKLLKSMSK